MNNVSLWHRDLCQPGTPGRCTIYLGDFSKSEAPFWEESKYFLCGRDISVHHHHLEQPIDAANLASF